jgi:hypothetical protein
MTALGHMEVQTYYRIWNCGKNLSQISLCARRETTETECVSFLMSCYTNKMRLPLYFSGLHLYEQDVSSYMNVVPSYSESVTTFNIIKYHALEEINIF